MPTVFPLSNHWPEGDGELSWLGPPLSLVLANARVRTRDMGQPLHFVTPISTSIAQSFLRHLLQHPVCIGICHCPLIDDFMQFVLTASTQSSFTDYYSILTGISPSRMVSPSCCHPCSSLIQMTLSSWFLGSLERWDFWLQKEFFGPTNRPLLPVLPRD